MKPFLYYCMCAAITILPLSTVQAQTPAADSTAKQAGKDSTKKIHIQYHLSVNGSYSKNTAEQMLFTTNNFVSFTKKRYTLSQTFLYQYGTLRATLDAPKQQLQKETQTVTKLSYTIHRFEPFVMFGYERSNLKSINDREYICAGTEYYIFKKYANNMSVLAGLSYEWCDYTTSQSYNDLFYVFGIQGLQQLSKGKFNFLYNAYFYQKSEAARWRYNVTGSAMIRLIRPLYFIATATLTDEQVLGTETLQSISTFTLGFTFRSYDLYKQE